tara:strand:+ start:1163 stop:2401 length:1239 start_codon:yes stop_codon:yes gene_type:complete
MTNPLSFSNVVPEHVSSVCQQLVAHEIIPTAVGGVARDYLFGKKSFLDWDFEVRCKDNASFDIPEKLKSIFGDDIQDLGFGVLRLNGPNYQLEFSLPRKESFPIELQYLHRKPLGHKDVEFVLDQKLNFTESFKRRDLTINAIGFQFDGKGWALIDPYNGVEDLKNKIARPVSDDFAFDPVRYLRAIRFKILFNLEFSRDMTLAFSASNLEIASDHYLLYESTKAGFFPFMKLFFQLVEEHQTKLPESWQELTFLKDNELPALFCSPDQLLLQATWEGPWTLSDLGKLERFLKLRRGRAKHFVTGKDFAEFVNTIAWQDLVSQWKSSTWELVSQDDTFIKCVEAHKHWDSWTVAEEDLLLGLYPDSLNSLAGWRKYFPRELSGKESFTHGQKKDGVLPSQRSFYRLWCHLNS